MPASSPSSPMVLRQRPRRGAPPDPEPGAATVAWFPAEAEPSPPDRSRARRATTPGAWEEHDGEEMDGEEMDGEEMDWEDGDMEHLGGAREAGAGRPRRRGKRRSPRLRGARDGEGSDGEGSDGSGESNSEREEPEDGDGDGAEGEAGEPEPAEEDREPAAPASPQTGSPTGAARPADGREPDRPDTAPHSAPTTPKARTEPGTAAPTAPPTPSRTRDAPARSAALSLLFVAALGMICLLLVLSVGPRLRPLRRTDAGKVPQTQADVPQDPGGVAGRVGESVGEGEEGVVAGRGEGGGVIRPSRYPFLLLAPRRATPQQGIFAELPGFARTGENVFDGAGGPRFWRHKHPELGEALCAIGLGPDYAHRATFFGGLLSDGAVGMSRGEAAAAFARCLGAPTLSDGDRRLIVGEYADRFETYFKHLGLFEALADLGLWTPPADFVRKILTFGPPPLSDASSDPDDRQTIDLSDPARRGAFRLLHLALTKLGLPAAPQDLALAVRLAKASGPLPGARGPVRLLIHSGADADSPIVKQAVLEGPRYAGFKADKEEARCWRRWAEAGSLGGLPAELVERIALERWEGDCCAGGDL
ncbi:hypothetical protein DFJ74DRAFT_677838 [Hyaloraphidium curvatum]|nr:hypothetical protein DFJ74DRAFT_677838 [Hyaloraphidium curvatum]